MELRITDCLHVSDSPFKNFVESWLHLKGTGRKVSINAKGEQNISIEKADFWDKCANIIKCLSYALFLPVTGLALVYRTQKRSRVDKEIDQAIKNTFEKTLDLADFEPSESYNINGLKEALKDILEAKKSVSEYKMPPSRFNGNTMKKDFGEYLVKKDIIKGYHFGRGGSFFVVKFTDAPFITDG